MPHMIIDRMDDTPIEVPPGLANVVVTETALGDVRGREGFYHYRQYSAVDLARSVTLEEVWHLLLLGRLPGAGELAEFGTRIVAGRAVPEAVAALLPLVAAGPPMATLRTLLSGYGPRPVSPRCTTRRRRNGWMRRSGSVRSRPACSRRPTG
ncbi:citrate/2-methylcitrate synthase [Microlunatus speluncae]|uniref:citrate/2-methylcitrate synthase n=1 Tax=Microlunatus speluncae TaxID=2594267 RepID=UPI00248468FD|nr:citrate/2-methylcitrate synthase [Microlunatus speluncae]